jgi:hypothetical protein
MRGTVVTSCPGRARAKAAGTHSSSRMRTGEQRFAGHLDGCDSLSPLHGGEVLQEIVQRVASLEEIEEGLEWYSGTQEDRGATEYLRI